MDEDPQQGIHSNKRPSSSMNSLHTERAQVHEIEEAFEQSHSCLSIRVVKIGLEQSGKLQEGFSSKYYELTDEVSP